MEPYIGEIRIFAGDYAPMNWAICDGSLLSIAQYEALFALIGTTYGGDGQTMFRLPDLRGRVPVHTSSGQDLGSMGGAESISLTPSQFPAHSHAVRASDTEATASDPEGVILARSDDVSMYTTAQPRGTMNDQVISSAVTPSGDAYGGAAGHPHENMQPFQCVNYIICLNGIYPTPS